MIRPARASDVDAIASLVSDFDAETVGLLAENSTPRDIRRGVLFILTSPDTWLHVAERNSRVIGVFIGAFERALFARAIVAREVLWYIDPSERTGSTGMRLWRAFEEEAERRGAKLIGMTDITGRMAPHYERRGYTLHERVFGRLI